MGNGVLQKNRQRVQVNQPAQNQLDQNQLDQNQLRQNQQLQNQQMQEQLDEMEKNGWGTKFDDVQEFIQLQRQNEQDYRQRLQLPEPQVLVQAPGQPFVIYQPDDFMVNLSAAMSELNRDRNAALENVRKAFDTYLDQKGTYDLKSRQAGGLERQDQLELLMESLKKIISECDNNSYFRKKYRAGANAGGLDAASIKQQAEHSLEALTSEYISFMDQELAQRAKAAPEIHKRNKQKFKELQGKRTKQELFVEKSGRLDLDKLNQQNVYSENEQSTFKSYLRMKCQQVLRRVNTPGTAPILKDKREMNLINDILEYGKIESIGKSIGLSETNNSFTNSAIRKRDREVFLFTRIKAELDVLKDADWVTDDARALYRSFYDVLVAGTKGSLTIPADAKIIDYSHVKPENYQNTKLQKPKYDKIQYSRSVSQTDCSGQPLFAHPPCVSDIAQNSMGNCFLMSAIAELVAKAPQQVSEMFYDQGETVTVKLHRFIRDQNGERSEPVYIKVDKLVTSEASRVALWVGLLCKAYVVYRELYDDTFADNMVDTESRFALVRQKVNETKQNRLKKQKSKNGNAQIGQNEEEPLVIDYGYINNGGFMHDVFRIFTGQTRNGDRINEYHDISDSPVYSTNSYMEDFTFAQKQKYGNNYDSSQTDGTLFTKEKSGVFQYNGKQYVYQQSDLHEKFLQNQKYQSKEWWTAYFATYGELTNLIRTAIETQLANTRPDLWNVNGQTAVLKDHIGYCEEAKKVLNTFRNPQTLKGFIDNTGGKECLQWVARYAGLTKDENTNPTNDEQLEPILQQLAKDVEQTFNDAIAGYKLKEKAETEAPEHKIFTGQYSQQANVMYDRIKDLLDKGAMIGAGTGKQGTKKSASGNETLGVGVVGGHAYSVLDTKEVSFNGKTIKMIRVRNPWGKYTASYRLNSKGDVEAQTEQREDNGEFWIELTHFMKTFKSVQIVQ
ncbi:MAG: hypothetical protein K6B72_05800 [Lachnospiraceae bacterium]|nr:hypothetical protein [Lachnospiraceae bacterium]